MLSKGFFVSVILLFALCGIALAAKSRDRNSKPYRLICYYGAWANWRPGEGKITPNDFDANICTHMIYGFAVLKNDRITSHDPYLDLADDWGLDFYKRFNNLRQKNPTLTTLVAIGGWNEGDPSENFKYSKMAADPAKRKVFIDSVVEFLKKHDFDGLDFDWEYPSLRDEIFLPEDKANFVTVLKELREAFEPYGFLLTAAVAAGKRTIEAAYDIPQVSKYLDIINVMTYDFHGTWENFTGHHSPLYARPDERDADKVLNADYAIQKWIDNGADKSKITMGMPTYGRCYTLQSTTQTGYYAPTIGNGTEGTFTRLPGMQGYNELCFNLKSRGWKNVWNEYHLANYMYKGDQWCSYDDSESIRKKVEYLKAKGLSGAMIWSIDTDDFKGQCFGTKFPLIKQVLRSLDPTIPIESTDVPRPPLCHSGGYVMVLGDCKKFIQCVPVPEGFAEVEKECPRGLVFNLKIEACDYPENVPECN